MLDARAFAAAISYMLHGMIVDCVTEVIEGVIEVDKGSRSRVEAEVGWAADVPMSYSVFREVKAIWWARKQNLTRVYRKWGTNRDNDDGDEGGAEKCGDESELEESELWVNSDEDELLANEQAKEAEKDWARRGASS